MGPAGLIVASHKPQCRCIAIREQVVAVWHSAIAIYNHSYRVCATGTAYCQAGIVGGRGAGAYDHSI